MIDRIKSKQIQNLSFSKRWIPKLIRPFLLIVDAGGLWLALAVLMVRKYLYVFLSVSYNGEGNSKH